MERQEVIEASRFWHANHAGRWMPLVTKKASIALLVLYWTASELETLVRGKAGTARDGEGRSPLQQRTVSSPQKTHARHTRIQPHAHKTEALAASE